MYQKSRRRRIPGREGGRFEQRLKEGPDGKEKVRTLANHTKKAEDCPEKEKGMKGRVARVRARERPIRREKACGQGGDGLRKEDCDMFILRSAAFRGKNR